MEKVLGNINHLMDFKGNTASGFVFDFAAITQRIEGVLFATSAFELIGVIFTDLLL